MRKLLRDIFGRYFDRWRWLVMARWLEGDVLDVGCGSGWLYKYTKKDKIRRYLGVDVSDRREMKDFEFLEIDIDTGAREQVQGPFDRVVLAACIEHLAQPAEVLQWCRKILRPDGFLVLTTPTPRGQRLLRLIFAGGSEHTRIYNKLELFQELQLAGFEVRYYNKFEAGANQLVIAAPK